MGKKEQGYVGVIRDANNEVLGYAMKPEIKKLWEAAPDMLEALEALVSFQENNETEYLGMGHIRAYMRAKDAIAKAKGELS